MEEGMQEGSAMTAVTEDLVHEFMTACYGPAFEEYEPSTLKILWSRAEKFLIVCNDLGWLTEDALRFPKLRKLMSEPTVLDTPHPAMLSRRSPSQQLSLDDEPVPREVAVKKLAKARQMLARALSRE